MRQSGILGRAAIYALDKMVDILIDYHNHAKLMK